MNALAEQVYDAIVVGSGPGGATVARELALAGWQVLILERGPNRPISGTYSQTVRETLMPGKSLLTTPQGLMMLRSITVGGSSVYYYATALDPPTELLAKHGVDISAEIEELKEELPFGPLDDGLIGPIAGRIMESARELGFDWNPLPKLVFQDLCRSDCDKCALGCPYGAKWSSRFLLDEAVENGATLVDRALVKRVLVEDGVATGVEATVRGRRKRFQGSTVVVAAGGIGSPVVLRASGVEGVGRDFFFDPLVVLMGSVKDLSGGREFPMATGILLEDEGYVMTDIVWPRLVYQILAARVLRLHRLFGHRHIMPIMVKIRDELGGRLTDSGGVRKRLSDGDRTRLAAGSRQARRILENAGAEGIFSTSITATHPGGSVKIGDIVDSDLKTEVDHLFVCDCSVIPGELGLPPTLTVLGLGKRLAKHLVQQSAADPAPAPH